MSLQINKIYNMDFREGINQIEHIDLIATDPPYNIDFNYNEYDDNLSEEEYIKLLSHLKEFPSAIIHYPEETMKYIVPAMGNAPSECIAWCYNTMRPKNFRLINFFNIDVDFSNVKMPYKCTNDRRIQKRIHDGSEGKNLSDWFSDIQFVNNVSKERDIHPCPVPVALMERIILLTTKPGDIVVDPFSGGGTTAVACINTNRNFIGFEINEEYYKSSLMRIELTKGQMTYKRGEVKSKLFI